jgi:hypothetical protein
MLRYAFSRKHLIFISLGLLLLAAMTVVLAPKGVLADEGVPISGNFTVAIAFVQNSSACGVGDNCIACVTSDPPRFYIEAQGIGDTARLGTLFLKIQKCANPAASSFGSYEGTFTLTAPGGKDSLTGIYTGKNTSAGDAYGFGPFSGEWKITGGTGRFDDARGHVRFTAIYSGNGTAFYAVEGTVVSRTN